MIALPSASGLAQSDAERAGARAAAVEGAKAFKEQRWADAIDFFTRAEKVVHAPPHLLYIARAQVELGRLVAARENFLKIKRENLPPTAPQAFQAAKRDAVTDLAALEPRIPYVSVSVQGGDGPNINVTMDGKPVPSALVGVPTPVDPGEHKFHAKGDGVESAVATVNIKEGSKETVLLTLQPSPGATADGPGPGEAGLGGEGDGSEGGDDPGGDTGTSGVNQPMRIGSYAAFGVGVIGLGVGTIFALQSASKQSDSDDLFDKCDPDCTAAQKNEVIALDNDSTNASNVATAGFIIGGVGIAAGVALFFLSNQGGGEDNAQSGPTIQPWASFNSAGVTGTF